MKNIKPFGPSIGKGRLSKKFINKLNDELEKFKTTVEESNNLYESMLDKTTESLEKILLNTESISKIQ